MVHASKATSLAISCSMLSGTASRGAMGHHDGEYGENDMCPMLNQISNPMALQSMPAASASLLAQGLVIPARAPEKRAMISCSANHVLCVDFGGKAFFISFSNEFLKRHSSNPSPLQTQKPIWKHFGVGPGSDAGRAKLSACMIGAHLASKMLLQQRCHIGMMARVEQSAQHPCDLGHLRSELKHRNVESGRQSNHVVHNPSQIRDDCD